MCGAIGLICENYRDDLGQIASELLKMLEYRGYDSTGAAIQGESEDVWLAKGVGAPSRMVHKLGIIDRGGKIFCGQVRWATFGAVDEANSQPHDVNCKTHLYGAHNGNVTNCDTLKSWLQGEGHWVKSDNDGEMVVHTIEHCFARALEGIADEKKTDVEARKNAMRTAIAQAIGRIEGSFAAVIVDPVSQVVFAMKLGSSLYFGFGRDDKGGQFGIASSDLSSVLHLTRFLIPLNEGDLVEFSATDRKVYRLRDESRRPLPMPQWVERDPVRSRLQTDETALMPPFKTFMAQEISAQEFTVRRVVERFLGGTESEQALRPFLDKSADAMNALHTAIRTLGDMFSNDDICRAFLDMAHSDDFHTILQAIPTDLKKRLLFLPPEQLSQSLVSKEAGLLSDLIPQAKTDEERAALRLMDLVFDGDETANFTEVTDQFTDTCLKALTNHGRLFVICCGSSFHAAKVASLFFNELAHTELIPLLPGDFRAQYNCNLRPEDVIIAVSQSGETKDLIDVINDALAVQPDLFCVGIVNNLSSTLGQEKCRLVIPLQCGPEIAVPATKSFLNQVALFYCLALKLARRRVEEAKLLGDDLTTIDEEALTTRYEKLRALPDLIRAAIEATEVEVESAAQQLYLAPSIHLLATRITAIAMEGALKIREVVLNHAQGFEASEFKHGPNTLLGVNTVYGPQQINALLRALEQQMDAILKKAAEDHLEDHRRRANQAAPRKSACPQPIASTPNGRLDTSDGASGMALDLMENMAVKGRRLAQAALENVFAVGRPFALKPSEEMLFDENFDRSALFDALNTDYPLIFITGPSDRDVALTVSQINTHKIRGASPFIIAEEAPALRAAAEKPPTDNPAYRYGYLVLPRTGDTLMTIFTASVVLQRLALRMSVLKSMYLDRIGFKNHGVHPDVPKNVSKSITVD